MKIEVFDFETILIKSKHKPYLLSFSNDKVYKCEVFKENNNINIVVFILLNFKHNYYYYSHNLIFDFLLIFDGILELNIKYDWKFINFKLYEVRLYYHDKIIILRCSYSLMPVSLSKLNPFLTDKKKMYFPYKILDKFDEKKLCFYYKNIPKEYANITILEYYKIYSINDIIMLKESMLNFLTGLREYKILKYLPKLTLGSQAMDFYLKYWNEIPLKLNKNTESIIKTAYFGGRCEVFGNVRSGEKILHFDFKSMYGSCMKEELPYGDFEKKNKDFDINEPGFYYITVEYYDDIPILPVKTGKLFFKNGEITGWYWYEEIKIVLKYSKLKFFKIHKALISTKNKNILNDFILSIEKLKCKNELYNFFGKILINSFYGKLSINKEVNIMCLERKKNINSSYMQISDYYITKKKIQTNHKSNISIAAAITSKARIKLYMAFLEIQNHGGRLLYCDTDSVFAAFPKDAKIENTKLGDNVFFDTNKYDTEIKDAVFISPKNYSLILKNNKEIIKIHGNEELSLKFSKIKKYFYSNKNYICIKKKIILKKSMFIQNKLKIIKIKLNIYEKRRWLDNKTNTEPYILTT